MIKPISNEGSFAKKAAAVVGIAAVAGSAIYALKKGQLPDTFEGGKAKQVATTMLDGYKKLGVAIKDKAVQYAGKAKEKAPGVIDNIKTKVQTFVAKFRPAAEEVVEDLA